ncbi:MAG: DNA glycosylase, partial [Dermacoccus nishinomiyaensis]
MPEGDTVMWAAARLNRALLGQRLTRTDLRTPRLATVDLSGRECLPVVTHGKHMLHRLEGGVTIHSHFKMEGRWSLLP